MLFTSPDYRRVPVMFYAAGANSSVRAVASCIVSGVVTYCNTDSVWLPRPLSHQARSGITYAFFSIISHAF